MLNKYKVHRFYNKCLSIIVVIAILFTGILTMIPVNPADAAVISQTVELTVTEADGVPRTNWPVSSGIPIPIGDISSTDNFQLLDATQSTEIPCEITATSYWLDGSIKWVLLEFQASVPANQSVHYYLKYGTSISRSNFTSNLSINENTDSINVSTGSLNVTVGKTGNFRVLQNAVLNGTTLIPDTNLSDMKLVDSDNNVYKASLAAPTSVVVEKNNKLHAIIKIEGTYVQETPPTPQPRDILFSNGYEPSETSTWGSVYSGSPSPTPAPYAAAVFADTTVKFSGAQSMKLVNNTIYEAAVGGPVYDVTPGETYTLSAALRNEGVNMTSGVRVIALDAAGKVVNWYLAYVSIGQDVFKWRAESQTFTIPSGATRIALQCRSGDLGTSWFDDIKLERNSPQIKGEFKYSIRLHFYPNKDYVRMEHTLISEKSKSVSLKEISIENKFNLAGLPQSYAFGAAVGEYTGTLGQTIPNSYIFQDKFRDPVTNESHYAYYENNLKMSEDSFSSGWADLSTESGIGGGAGGIGIAVRDFNEQYPKSLYVESNMIVNGLWAPYSTQYTTIDPGSTKTHDIGYYFHAGSYTQAGVKNFATSFQKPLQALASPSWYCSTKALGAITPEVGGEFTTYESMSNLGWNYYAGGNADHSDSNEVEYGMLNYGDWSFHGWTSEADKSYGNIEYDTPYSLSLAFARTGNINYLWAGEIAAKHFADMDINWGYPAVAHDYENPAYVITHGLYHTKGGFHSGHIWSGGLANYYLLTGERRLLDAAKEAADSLIDGNSGIEDVLPKYYSQLGRKAGWSLWTLLNTYYAANDPKYLDHAQALIENMLAFQEPNRGLWESQIGEYPAEQPNGETFMILVLLKSFIEYDRFTQGTPREISGLREAIVKGVDWLMDEAYVDSRTTFFYKQCPQLMNNFDPEIDAMAFEPIVYAATITGDMKYLVFAKKIFDVATSAVYANWQNAIDTGYGLEGKYVTLTTRSGPGYINEVKALGGEPADHTDVVLEVSAPEGIVGGYDTSVSITAKLKNLSSQPLSGIKISLSSCYLFSASPDTVTTGTINPGGEFTTVFNVSVPATKQVLEDYLAQTRLDVFKFHVISEYYKGSEYGGEHKYVGLRSLSPQEITVSPSYLIKSNATSPIKVDVKNYVNSAYESNLIMLNSSLPSGWSVAPFRQNITFAGKGSATPQFSVTPAVNSFSLVNPSFENDLTGWSSAAPQYVSIVNTAANTGSKAARIDGTSGTKSVFQTFTVPAGTAVRMGAWFKAETASVNVMTFYAGAPYQWTTITPSQGWVYVTCEANGDGLAHQVQLIVNGGAAYCDSAWFGDSRCVPGNYETTIIEAGPQQYANPDFENSLTSWNVSNTSKVTVNSNANNIYSGSKSVRLDGTGGNVYLFQSQTYPTGKSHHIGAWFKAETSSVNVMVFRAGGLWQWKAITPSDGWVYITNEALSDGAAHQTQLLVSGGIAYADTADLEEIIKKDPINLQLAPAYKFDIGMDISSVATGYLRVTGATVYNVNSGYGWLESLAGCERDRNTSDPLLTDLITMAPPGTGRFKIDLENGSYWVKIIAGDASAHLYGMDVYAGGIKIINNASAAKGEFYTGGNSVQVTQGNLELEFKSTTYDHWKISAIEIYKL